MLCKLWQLVLFKNYSLKTMSNHFHCDYLKKSSGFDGIKMSGSERNVWVKDNFDNSASKGGVKRPRLEDSTDFFIPKRVCTQMNKPFSPQTPFTKNLANSRLQKIREKLRTELIAEASNAVSKSPEKSSTRKFTSKSNFEAATVESGNKTSDTDFQISSKPRVPQKIYKDQNKRASPPDSSETKNLANQRLEKLKIHLTPNTSVSTDDKCKTINNDRVEVGSHRSPLLIGTKRHISDASNDCCPLKRIAVINDRMEIISQQSSQNLSPNLTNVSTRFLAEANQNCDNKLDVNKSSQSDIPINKHISLCHNLKKRSRQIFTKFKEKIKNKGYTVPVPVINLPSPTIAENTVDIPDKDINSPISNFKPPSTPFKPNTSSPVPNPSPSNEPGDSFSARMERTALWVKNTLSNTTFNNEGPVDTSERKPQQSCSSEDNEMEWTNAEPDEEPKTNNNSEPVFQENQDISSQVSPQKSSDLCIVVDTNIFISSLSKVKDVLSMTLPGSSSLFLYIPWMVMEELDYMKDRCSDAKLKKNIMKSIKFINEALSKDDPKVRGQTVLEAGIQPHIGSSQDDKIIACCLQVAENYTNVILLSNDMNLKNKALINNIGVCSAHEVIMKIMSKFVTSNKSKKILQKMSILCSSIICECAKDTYGNAWSKMEMLSCPPWSLLECVKRFKRYWNTIFKDKMMKQCPKTLDELSRFLKDNICFSDDSQEYIKFVKLCIALCLFLKDINEHRGSVEITIRDITKIG